MRVFIIIALMIILGNISGYSEDIKEPLRPVHTYSIVAYDTVTGQFGAAVQSHYFRVADVIWAKPGVGAVATQSLVDFSYGPLGLAMMQKGKTAEQALTGLLASDPGRAVRQVAMIDKEGNVAVHTGAKCIAEAGHIKGPNYSCQANLMENNTVWGAMAEAFETTDGDLAEKMMAALDAAQAEGGDIRGKQSAALLVVSGEPTGMSWRDKIFDIRVDDSPEPLKELHRLLNISRAYKHVDKGDEYMSEGEFDKANDEYAKAVTLAPGNSELRFWQAATLVSLGEVEASLPIFKEVFEADQKWRELVPRLVESDILPDDREVIERIMKQ